MDFNPDGKAAEGLFQINLGMKWGYDIPFKVDGCSNLVLGAPSSDTGIVPVGRYKGNIIDYIIPLVKSVADGNGLKFVPTDWMTKPYSNYYDAAGRKYMTDLAQATNLLKARLGSSEAGSSNPDAMPAGIQEDNRVSLTLRRASYSVLSLSGNYMTHASSHLEFKKDGHASQGFFEVNLGTKRRYAIPFVVGKGECIAVSTPNVKGQTMPPECYRGDIIDYIFPLVSFVAGENKLEFKQPIWMTHPYAGYYEADGHPGRDRVTDLAQVTALLSEHLRGSDRNFPKPEGIFPRLEGDEAFVLSYGPH
jgi:hypothetical protein